LTVAGGTKFEVILLIWNLSRRHSFGGAACEVRLVSHSGKHAPSIATDRIQTLPLIEPNQSALVSLTFISPSPSPHGVGRSISIWQLLDNSERTLIRGRFVLDIAIATDAKEEDAFQWLETASLSELLVRKCEVMKQNADTDDEQLHWRERKRQLHHELRQQSKTWYATVSNTIEALRRKEAELHNKELELLQREQRLSQRIQPNDIELGVLVGRGNFGNVYRATWTGVEVAVKAAPVAVAGEYSTLSTEIELLKQFSHPNVLRFFGSCTGMNRRASAHEQWIVVEFASNGSLREFLDRQQGATLPIERQLSFVADIAAG
jgi:hypothetical protein